MRKDRYKPSDTPHEYNLTNARIKLAEITENAMAGHVSTIFSTHGRKIAVMPFYMYRELLELREAQPSLADTIGREVSRTEALPSEVSAHSQPAPAAKRTAFGLIAPFQGGDNER